MEQQEPFNIPIIPTKGEQVPLIPEIMPDNLPVKAKTVESNVDQIKPDGTETKNTIQDTELTAKQKILVRNYKGKGTLKRAARLADMSYSYARTAINFPHVRRAIKKKETSALHIATKRASINIEQIISQEKTIAFSNLSQLFDTNKTNSLTLLSPSDLPEEVAQAIKRFTVIEVGYDKQNDKKLYKYSYEFYDKGKSLERLGKHLGMYNQDKKIDISIHADFDFEAELSAKIKGFAKP